MRAKFLPISRRISFLLGITLLATPGAFATTYYIDFASGSDTNNGTAKTTPWKHAPGMPACSNTCRSTTPQPGDNFILKGGVTWPMNIIGCWNWSWSGSAGNYIYIGVDKTWYSGASWARPILTGNGASVGTCAVNPTIHNDFMMMVASYWTVDNFEFTGALWGTDGYLCDNYLATWTGLSGHYTVSNCYAHGWSDSSNTGESGCAFCSASYQTGPFPMPDTVLEYNVVDGSDTAPVLADPTCATTCTVSTAALGRYWSDVRYNIARYAQQGFDGVAINFHDNLIEYMRRAINPDIHVNSIQFQQTCNARVYNNVVRHTYLPAKSQEGYNLVNYGIPTNYGCTSYVFNNIGFNMPVANGFTVFYNPATAAAQGTQYVYNNTVECGPDAGSGPTGACVSGIACAVRPYTACIINNNHFITSVTPPVVINCGANCTNGANFVTQSKAAANAQGYSAAQSYAFSPTASGNATVAAGANLTSVCSGDGHLANLCKDTTYAVTYDAVNHVAVAPTRVPAGRPSSGAWDVGAYQYSGTVGSKPQPPAALTAIVR